MQTVPSKIKLHKQSQTLELQYGEHTYQLPAEFLRVLSPSAEVRGHGKGQEVLQTGKINVRMDKIEAQGNYGLRITFNDFHDSGIYTWDYLAELCANQVTYWETYLDQLQKAGQGRDPDEQAVRLL